MKSGSRAWATIPAAARALTWRSGGRERHLVFGANDGPPPHRVAQPGFVPQNLGVNLLFKGRGRYRDWENREHALGPGSLYTRRPGLPSSLAIDSGGLWREWFFTVDPATFAELESCGLLLARALVSSDLAPACVQSWRDLRLSLDGPAPPPAARALHAIVGLLDQAARPAGSGALVSLDSRLARAARLLEGDFSVRLDLATVAKTVGLGHETLRKSFRARFGVSPGRYRVGKRIETAKALLAQDTLQIQEIASLLGYPDPFAFSAQFRAHVGRSPRAYRAR